MNSLKQPPSSRLYGRRKGRPLHTRKKLLMQELLPKLLIKFEEGTHTPPQEFFSEGKAACTLEIGFGGGEHLAALAKRHPEKSFIGCEPFMNGVAGLLDHIEREGLENNIRIFDNDARLLLDALTESSIEEGFVLFPDPWPKKRHIERRFIGPENLNRLARVLKPGALLRLASDHASLIAWMRECLSLRADFACIYASAEPPANWIPTRYQEKAVKAGRQAFFMDYRRK